MASLDRSCNITCHSFIPGAHGMLRQQASLSKLHDDHQQLQTQHSSVAAKLERLQSAPASESSAPPFVRHMSLNPSRVRSHARVPVHCFAVPRHNVCLQALLATPVLHDNLRCTTFRAGYIWLSKTASFSVNAKRSVCIWWPEYATPRSDWCCMLGLCQWSGLNL